jgi:hypothetical protein
MRAPFGFSGDLALRDGRSIRGWNVNYNGNNKHCITTLGFASLNPTYGLTSELIRGGVLASTAEGAIS